MQTLAEISWPTVNDPLQFILVAAGLIVLVALMVQLFRSKNISPYQGMPALVAVLALTLLLVGGSVVDLTQWPAVVATVIGFITEFVTSVFLWPYMLMILIAQGVRITGIASGDKFTLFKGNP